MNTYIATFFTHYGALKFHKECKKLTIASKIMPVPRKLSSSCGTCVCFEALSHLFAYNVDVQEDFEKCFLVVSKDEYKSLNAAD